MGKSLRTPGEIAFDRCFFPVASFVLFGIAAQSIQVAQIWDDTPEALMEGAGFPREALVWLLFVLGLLLGALWGRALISLIRSWRDPSARVLRISSTLLLIPFAFQVCVLLAAPFL
jgi:hypothetical protein